MPRRKVGLLGGSFNPAHGGHRHVSLLALQLLGLDEVWWLVSPQNPLKPIAGMAPLAARLASARAAARHPRIRVTDIERRLGTRYTVDTLRRLRRRHGNIGFVWLIGADNLVQMPRWHRWQEIFTQVPVAVFARGGAGFRALAGPAASRYRRFRLNDPRLLATARPPAWCFLFTRRHPASSTAIRAGRRRRGGTGAP